MKWWLTVFFLVNGTWVPGDQFDGWSPRPFESQQECIEHKIFAEKQCDRYPLDHPAAWVCSYASPAKVPPPEAVPGIDC